MIHVALAQLNSNDDTHRNLKKILELIDEACLQNPKPDLIIFPENSVFFRMSSADKVEALPTDSGIWDVLKNKAKSLSVHLHLTTALIDTDQKIYNGSILIRPDGKLELVYRKIHLFDIALTGQKPIRESDVFQFGKKVHIFLIKGFKFGSSICYDIRFSELYAHYAKEEVDVILVPSAFLVKTGEAHWHTLLKARAIESQCYVLAPAQTGNHFSVNGKNQRETYGHSVVVGPWGEIIKEKPDQVGLISADLLKSEIHRVREQIPMKSHRRL